MTHNNWKGNWLCIIFIKAVSPPLYIAVIVTSQVGDHIFVLGVSVLPLSTSFILDFGAVPTVSYLFNYSFIHCITILSLIWDPCSYLAYHDIFERSLVAPLWHIILISGFYFMKSTFVFAFYTKDIMHWEDDTGQFDTLVCVIGPFVALHVLLDIALSETVISSTVTSDRSPIFSSWFWLCCLGLLVYLLSRRSFIGRHALWTVISLTVPFTLWFWLSFFCLMFYLLPRQCFIGRHALWTVISLTVTFTLRFWLSCLGPLFYLLPRQCFDYNHTRQRLFKKSIANI